MSEPMSFLLPLREKVAAEGGRMRGFSDLTAAFGRAAGAVRPLIRRLRRHLLPQGEKGRRGVRLLFTIFAAALCLAAAADPTERLADPAQEARARAMFREVRCLVCQNESIDDSQ
ncbi:MAG: cytochrome, partial [Caulobacter sp.]|nr:cytochrome [Caulobacter sp.]